jgi:hypothetical protein
MINTEDLRRPASRGAVVTPRKESAGDDKWTSMSRSGRPGRGRLFDFPSQGDHVLFRQALRIYVLSILKFFKFIFFYILLAGDSS